MQRNALPGHSCFVQRLVVNKLSHIKPVQKAMPGLVVGYLGSLCVVGV